MRHTVLKEVEKVELRNPLAIEGFPGLGMVGKIAVTYLVKELEAKPLLELYSGYFPYHVLVDDQGVLRLLRAELYHCSSQGQERRDAILMTGDHQAQTLEGQYEVSSAILSYLKKHGVKRVIAIGGYEALPKGEPRVIGATTDPSLIHELEASGAHMEGVGNPIVGMAGVLLGLARFHNMDGLCLLAETPGYAPDPKAAMSALSVLQSLVGWRIDLKGLEEEAAGVLESLAKMQEVAERAEALERSLVRRRGERATYIA